MKNPKKILTEVLPYISDADFVIPNLECPLGDINNYNPIKKSGPNLICNSENVCFIKAMSADAVTVANNHIGDFGEKAVAATISLLEENNIMYAGAGRGIENAYKAFQLKKDGILQEMPIH